jgi:arylamine N-acetyltransferase
MDNTVPAALTPELRTAILANWGLSSNRPPDLVFLDDLVSAYTRSVPWESAFRIVKRARIRNENGSLDPRLCPRWPAEFWTDALEWGGGGTCFESNYAFIALLRSLGYEGYLTINNMGDSIGCHAAIVLRLDGRPWLVDAGLPLYRPLPIDPAAPTERPSPFHCYTVRPDGRQADGTPLLQVERDRHPKPNCYTLVYRPVPDFEYRSAVTADYGPQGYFLDRVIVNKVIDGQVWRFNSEERPLHLESFAAGGRRSEYPIDGDVAEAVSVRFGLAEAVIRSALAAINPEV